MDTKSFSKGRFTEPTEGKSLPSLETISSLQGKVKKFDELVEQVVSNNYEGKHKI